MIEHFDDSLSQPLLLDGPNDAAYLAAARIAKDMRGFIIARHTDFGFILLRSFKRKKGEHFQLPGGRVDPEDVITAKSLDAEEVARVAAAREFFEETGIDLRNNLQRLKCLKPLGIGEGSRYFFELLLNQDDSISPSTGVVASVVRSVDGADNESTQASSTNDSIQGEGSPIVSSSSVLSVPITGELFNLRLSSEHTGFCFVQSLHHAAELASQHSGGFSSSALLQYLERLDAAGTTTLCSDTSNSTNQPTSAPLRRLHVNGELNDSPPRHNRWMSVEAISWCCSRMFSWGHISSPQE